MTAIVSAKCFVKSISSEFCELARDTNNTGMEAVGSKQLGAVDVVLGLGPDRNTATITRS